MSRERRHARSPGSERTEPLQAKLAPGKLTLTGAMVGPVQARSATPGTQAGRPAAGATSEAEAAAASRNDPARPSLASLFGQPSAPDAAETRVAAARGVATPSSALPHVDAIQRSFGHHDVSSIKAHIGADASASARALGAAAYATGSDAVFDGVPDLHTAAHEAAHVVQQRSGVQLYGGVGEVGDEYERHADAIADLVVRGGSAQALLDAGAGSGGAVARAAPAEAMTGSTPGGSPPPRVSSPHPMQAIQRKVGFEFETQMPLSANGRRVIAKNAELYRSVSRDWYITPDAGCIEFVTEPFEEEGETPEFDKMRRAVEEIVDCLTLIDKFSDGVCKENKDCRLSDILTEGKLNQHQGHDLYIPKDRGHVPLTAVPQVTGGVTLDHIVALFDACIETQLPVGDKPPQNRGEKPEPRSELERTPLGGNNYKKEAEILSTSKDLAGKYVASLKDATEGWEKLEGMLALIYSYLLSGAHQEYVMDQAKYVLPAMSRMSFTAMYKSLPDPAQKAFNPERVLQVANLRPEETVYAKGFSDTGGGDRTQVGAPKMTPENRVALLMQQLQQEEKEKQDRTQRGTRDIVEKTRKPAVREGYDQVQVTGFGPTRQTWLQGIVDGIDYMSVEGKTSVTKGMAASSPAMGEHDKLDEGHGGAKLVQVELRRLPKSVASSDWVKLATALFGMFARVQAGKSS